MKIYISQQIGIKGSKCPVDIHKEFNSDIIPHAGDFISDPIWKDPYEYEVINVNINYEENECYVTVDKLNFEVDDFDKYVKDCAKLHGWNNYSCI